MILKIDAKIAYKNVILECVTKVTKNMTDKFLGEFLVAANKTDIDLIQENPEQH